MDITSKELLSMVSQVRTWCAHSLRVDDPAGSLRTISLKPSLVIIEQPNQGRWNYEVNPFLEIARLCERRLSLIQASGLELHPISNLSQGQMLLFYPHETLSDGAAHETSRGYFDSWNIPPWDTWLAYEIADDGNQALYTWVPTEFVPLAAAGVAVNPEECLRWIPA